MTYRAEDWKAGDVALIPFSRGGVRAMYTGDGWVTCDRTPVRAVADYINMRRLVVIDAEDHEQVERLRVTYNAQTRDNSVGFNPLQAALREFATPTPVEPTDPKARVIDRRDNIWRLLADGDWVCTDGPDVGEYLAWWQLAGRGAHVEVTP